MDEVSLYDSTNVYTSMQPRLPRSLLVYMGGWIQRKASDKSYYYDINSNHWVPIPKLDLKEKLSYFKCEMVNKVSFWSYCSYNSFYKMTFKTVTVTNSIL